MHGPHLAEYSWGTRVLVAEQKRTHVAHGASGWSTRIVLEGQWVRPLDVEFRPEGLGARPLWKLFSKDHQVGDPEFDDAVFVFGESDDEALRWLLADASAREAIEILCRLDGTIELEGRQLRLVIHRTEHEPLYDFVLPMLVIARRLLGAPEAGPRVFSRNTRSPK